MTADPVACSSGSHMLQGQPEDRLIGKYKREAIADIVSLIASCLAGGLENLAAIYKSCPFACSFCA